MAASDPSRAKPPRLPRRSFKLGGAMGPSRGVSPRCRFVRMNRAGDLAREGGQLGRMRTTPRLRAAACSRCARCRGLMGFVGAYSGRQWGRGRITSGKDKTYVSDLGCGAGGAGGWQPLLADGSLLTTRWACGSTGTGLDAVRVVFGTGYKNMHLRPAAGRDGESGENDT